MAKYTAADLTSLTSNEASAVSTINSNFAGVEVALEKTLSRDGTSPNQMDADIDLNSNDLLNVGTIDTDILIVNGQVVSAPGGGVLTGPQGDPGVDATPIAGIGYTIEGGAAAILTGSPGPGLQIPFACTILGVTLLADQVGSVVVDILKATYASYPTATSICASSKPTLSTAQKYTDSTLTGWTTAVAAGDTLQFNVDSAATITSLSVILKVQKI